MRKIVFSTVAVAALLTLSGCVPALSSTSPASGPDESSESSGPSPEPSFAESPDAEEEVGNLAFGDAVAYADNVSISVSVPAAYAPDEYAAGNDQAHNVAFTVTITNGSTENVEPAAYASVSSGGVEGSQIFDSALSTSPTTVLLPGQTVTWVEAYSIADPASIVFQISPSFEYDSTVFTNVAA